jgi:hypothetical protein
MGHLGMKQPVLLIKNTLLVMKNILSYSRLSQYIIKSALFLFLICSCLMGLKAQNCTSLYLITGADGKVYAIDVSTGNKTLVTTMTSGKENLAVGPNPTSTSTTVFTSSQKKGGSTVYKSNTSISTTLPAEVKGLTANPATTGGKAGFVYGISSTKQLIKASPAPASNLGVITGDAAWSGGTIDGDAFFDNADNLWTLITNGTAKYLYKININALTASQEVQLSGSLPTSFKGVAYLNSKIYAAETYTTGAKESKLYFVQLYEINANTGQGIIGASIALGSTDIKEIDLASCDVLIPEAPAGAPSCNQLFGIEWLTHKISQFDPTALSSTIVSSGNQGDQGNMAFGPVPTNLNQNQFVTSPNSVTGNIYKDVNNTGTLTSTGNTWGIPIGLGTDPATGIVWGLNDVTLTKWTGSGNAITMGAITGDATWTGGTSLNDIAVDAGGNLYSIVFNGANTYLYRINPTTRVAKRVVQATGSYITDGTSNNGNGMAYLGNYFYYSRINGSDTDVWALDAMTGVSIYVGLVSGIRIADLGSCATVTNIPADFTFNCGAAGGGLQGANFLTGDGNQTGILRVPITNTVTGLGTFTVTGSGISTYPSAYTLTIAQDATYVDVPILYDGSGAAGSRSLSVTVTGAIFSGICSIPITIDACAAGTVKPTLSVTSKTNNCPATTVDLSTITASNNPGGSVVLTWHTGTPATTANKISSVTALPEGTYYAAFYDPIIDCYSGVNGSATTVVKATLVFCCDASTVTPPLNKN